VCCAPLVSASRSHFHSPLTPPPHPTALNPLSLTRSIAGQVGWVVSIAPDTIKSRIQTSSAPMPWMATMKSIVAEGGYRGLFAGIEVAIVRAFPANAALFVGYEFAKRQADKWL